MGTQSLVALDTDHIKQYVFATDKLKEIRGASSILDRLNRRAMKRIAENQAFRVDEVYANGGSGLYLVDGDKHVARKFGLDVQREYRKITEGGASITFVVQELPASIQNTADAWKAKIPETLEMLRYRLAERKVSWLPEKEVSDQDAEVLGLPSHPFMRTCDACGIRYAQGRDPNESAAEARRERYYCSVCLAKRTEDRQIKEDIDDLVKARAKKRSVVDAQDKSIAWKELLGKLPESYKIEEGTVRPEDFNELRGLSGGKDYLALIYADGNGMGQVMEELSSLAEIQAKATAIDKAIYQALSTAISQHLPVVPGHGSTPSRFPFDVLLVGGDDTMLVTVAPPALDVALSIARNFQALTRDVDPKNKGLTLSVGVVLAPMKYPFGMLHDLVEETLQAAKKEGAIRCDERKRKSKNQSNEDEHEEAMINFMVVTGSTSQKFSMVSKSLHSKRADKDASHKDINFCATLRPYTLDTLEMMLSAIRAGRKKRLGRTKLHQVREAVLKMNLTTSIYEGMAVLRNWSLEQRSFVVEHVQTMGQHYNQRHHDATQPGTLFPRVSFPWFADGSDTYRSSLLDFVELYDFVGLEGGADEN
ncbi:MAG TPA: hypothetical protein VFV38_29270 [Ktedonobacteraceae bacterium]|nr:hypothetical protein [Ktedonobacteraceae bacterium]